MALPDNIEYGVTKEGFVRKRLSEIKEDMFVNLETKLGVPVSREPNSMLGVLIGIYASEIDRQWQLAEKDYYDRSPMSASEGSIDNTLEYTMVTRQVAQKSSLYAVCYGVNGTVIPSNAMISNTDTDWQISESAIELNKNRITLDNCVSLIASLDNVESTERYGFTIGNDACITGGLSAEVICQTLKTRIEKLNDWKVTVEGNIIQIEQEKDENNRRYGEKFVLHGFTPIQVGTPIMFRCTQVGAIEPNLNSITTMKTVYQGWNSVSNESPAYIGRDDETLTELRQRYAAAVFRKSVSMKESLASALSEIEDVRSVIVYENKSDEPLKKMINGKLTTIIKPHSFRVVIDGGDDTLIAQTILDKAPLGIDSSGLGEPIRVQDSSGLYDDVWFDRPIEIPIYMRITIEQYPEETIPGDIVETIKTLIYQQGKKFDIGLDVIPQRFFGTLYSNITGIGNIKIEISQDNEHYTTERMPIEEDSYAAFSTTNMYVIIKALGD